MRVVQAEQPGGPEVLVPAEAPDPVAGPGEVVVDVAVAAVTFVETLMRAGRFGPPNFPRVLGNGVAGTVAEVGEGVDAGLLGRQVVTTTGGSGGYAERVAVPAAELHLVPESLSLRTAAALIADGRTAVGLAGAATIKPGDAVLVTAAGGGVGSLLVQLARRAEAGMVIALAGGEPKRARARELGADLAVDYRRPGWDDEVRAATEGRGVDVAFDGVGGDVGTAILGVLAPGARLLIHGMAGGSMTQVPPETKVALYLTVIPLPQVLAGEGEARAATATALQAAADGWLVPTIGQEYPLAEAAAAHRAIEARETVGKTLLIP